MKRVISLAFICAILLGSAASALADQIILKNGDKLSGKIVKKDADKVTIQTEFAGLITISGSNIESIIEQKEEEKTPSDETKNEKMKGGGDFLPEEMAAAKEEENGKEAPAAIAPAPKKKALGLTSGWDGSANLGFSLTSGNSKTSTLTAGVRAEKSGVSDKWILYGNSLLNRNRVGSATVTTSNATWGGLRYDRNITKKLFAFGSYDIERDRPQLLNFRSVLGGGLGYHAIKNEKTELDLFGGAAWNRTWYTGPNNSSAELLLGNTLKHKFNEKTSLQQRLVVYPNLSDGGEYRAVLDATLSTDLTKRIGLFVTIGDRFNSLPVAGAQKNDFLFATGLKVAFGKKK